MPNSRSSFTRWKTTILTLLLACACCALSTRPAIAQPAPPAPVLLSAAPTPLRVPLPQETLTIGESYRIGFDAPSVPPPDGLVYRYRIYIGDTAVVPNAQAGPQGNEMPAPTARGTLAIRASIRYVIVDQSKWEPCGQGTDCAEVFSDTLTVAVTGQTVPEPPAPSLPVIIRSQTETAISDTGAVLWTTTRTEVLPLDETRRPAAIVEKKR